MEDTPSFEPQLRHVSSAEELLPPPRPKKTRPRRLQARRPPLTIEQILSWADAHHARTGRWPRRDAGPVQETVGENWSAINLALRRGYRDLEGGSSLALLLEKHRGVRPLLELPPLTVEQILEWADAHYTRTGEWPTKKSGAVVGCSTPGETWHLISVALQLGTRTLPGGSSLPRLLAEHRGRRNRKGLSGLTEELILAWADAHRQRTGEWPTRNTPGSIPQSPQEGDTWERINNSLVTGLRGLAGGSSLARVLAAHRGVRNRKALPHLTVPQVLGWADAHHERCGSWPNEDSGPVVDAPGETWSGINAALSVGIRGLAGGTTLYRLLIARGRMPPHPSHPVPDARREAPC